MKRKKEIKKNRKLLLQIGIVTMFYSVMTVLLFSAILYFAVMVVYVKTKTEQVTENAERLHRTLFDREYGVNLNARMLDRLEKEPELLTGLFPKMFDPTDEVLDEMTRDYYAYQSEWLEQNGAENAEFDAAYYANLPDDLIGYTALSSYFNLFALMMMEEEEYQYERLLYLDIQKDADGVYQTKVWFLMEKEDNTDLLGHYNNSETVRTMMKKNRFGEIWGDLAEHSELRKMIETNGQECVFETDMWKEGAESLTGYYPVYFDGRLRGVLGITYDWASVQDSIKENATAVGRIFLVILMFSEGMLLLFIYFMSVRPLRKVMKALANYIEDRKSSEVVRKMGEVKLRNEFGRLADYVSSMVQSIDRFTAENMELAGEKEKAATELELAAKIQNGMLREDFPNTPELEIYALMDPAKEVGGDFYDFFEVDSSHMALVIADVAGKGVPGSLFMMSALTMIRGKTMAGVSPAEILAEVNNGLLKGGDFGDMFVTVWLGILDLESGILTAANAGHEYPVVKSGERFELLKDKHGFVVGGMEGVKYQNYEIDLSRGGTLFVYTDGVPEATAADDELYGTDRILETLNLYPDATPAELAKNVKLDVDLFVGEAEQFDDLTILCVRYQKSALRDKKPM